MNGACLTSLAPWMRVELPEGNGLDFRVLEKEIEDRCPFSVLTLDLLMQWGSQPPVWVCLRSRQGDVLPPGLVPAIRVRPKNLGELYCQLLRYRPDWPLKTSYICCLNAQCMGVCASDQGVSVCMSILCAPEDGGSGIVWR